MAHRNGSLTFASQETGTTVRVQYGRVLLATGVKPLSLSHIDEAVAPRVTTLRTMDDLLTIRGWWQRDTPATVTIVGAGLLGSELAWSMGARWMRCDATRPFAYALRSKKQCARPQAAIGVR